MSWSFAGALIEVWTDMIRTAGDAPGDERALRDVLSWAYAHEQTFFGRVFDYAEATADES